MSKSVLNNKILVFAVNKELKKNSDVTCNSFYGRKKIVTEIESLMKFHFTFVMIFGSRIIGVIVNIVYQKTIRLFTYNTFWRFIILDRRLTEAYD